MEEKTVGQMILERRVSRRDFLKFCAVMAGTLALPPSFAGNIAEAVEKAKKPTVVWLEFQDCAGCTESFLRASRPTTMDILLDVLAVNYHELIMAAAGHQAEAERLRTIEEGGYLLVVEGAIPTAADGAYCCIGGHSALHILEETAAHAAAVIAVGNCATFGGLPKAAPNPTEAVSVMELVKDKPVVNLPGCPLNAVNLTATIVHYLTFNELPKMDDLQRPLFAYGTRIHDNCERRGHFDAGEFVREWGDEGHRKGWCLYQMGCKGPVAFHNCPIVRWNDGTSWPVMAGHGCIGCSEPGFWEMGAYTPSAVFGVTPPDTYPPTELPEQQDMSAGNLVAAGAVGAAIGAAGVAAYNQLSKPEPEDT